MRPFYTSIKCQTSSSSVSTWPWPMPRRCVSFECLPLCGRLDGRESASQSVTFKALQNPTKVLVALQRQRTSFTISGNERAVEQGQMPVHISQLVTASVPSSRICDVNRQQANMNNEAWKPIDSNRARHPECRRRRITMAITHPRRLC